MPDLDDGLISHSQSQLERLAFIDFRAYFLGEVRRTDITDRFKVKEAAASRDLSTYKQMGGRIILDGSTKGYRTEPGFRPLFPHNIEHVFTALCQGFGEGSNQTHQALVPCETPNRLNSPTVETLAIVSRAIYQKRGIHIEYSSFSSGRTEREIIPHALANTGSRWHVRAYDRRRNRFTDFVLTRIRNPQLIDATSCQPHELNAHDNQWNRIVELEIVPHPGSKHHEIIAADYGMSHRQLNVNVRACLAGYYLRQWSVDCSPDHSIGPDAVSDGSNNAVRLWLKNPLALYGADSAILAPGYRKPE